VVHGDDDGMFTPGNGEAITDHPRCSTGCGPRPRA
jgi:hypothetical protein